MMNAKNSSKNDERHGFPVKRFQLKSPALNDTSAEPPNSMNTTFTCATFSPPNPQKSKCDISGANSITVKASPARNTSITSFLFVFRRALLALLKEPLILRRRLREHVDVLQGQATQEKTTSHKSQLHEVAQCEAASSDPKNTSPTMAPILSLPPRISR